MKYVYVPKGLLVYAVAFYGSSKASKRHANDAVYKHLPTSTPHSKYMKYNTLNTIPTDLKCFKEIYLNYVHKS